MAWFHRRYLAFDNIGNDSRTFEFIGKNPPITEVNIDKSCSELESLLLKMLLKCIYFDERREYSWMRLGQIVNRLITVDPTSIEFVMKLL
jgi:hypothetical protein